MTLNCVTCGKSVRVSAAELHWAPLSALSAAAAHLCREPVPVIQPPATPRPPSPANAAVQQLVHEHLTPDPVGVVLLDDLRALHQELFGRYPDSGLFSRELIRVLPPGTAIRREMINGVRARRLIGMRLK